MFINAKFSFKKMLRNCLLLFNFFKNINRKTFGRFFIHDFMRKNKIYEKKNKTELSILIEFNPVI